MRSLRSLAALAAGLILAAALAPAVVPPTALHAQTATFIGVRVDADRNKVLLEVPADKLGKDFLHQSVLATGAGVPSLGLDRGQTGGSEIVRLERHGKRLLMVQDNWSVRALGADAAAKRAVAESFPTSVIASFPIESEADGIVVVDATSFFLSDTYGIAESLRRGQAGTGRVDAARSWIVAERTKAFPMNTEIHAVLTFNIDAPGFALRRLAPDAGAPTFEVHHSLVALPSSEGFRPREGDARSGLFGTSFYDFGQGFDGTYRDGYANRWRLVPKDPAAYQPRAVPQRAPRRRQLVEQGLRGCGLQECVLGP
jgi:hypothetical protein